MANAVGLQQMSFCLNKKFLWGLKIIPSREEQTYMQHASFSAHVKLCTCHFQFQNFIEI
jgi:hypothetical protein